MVASLPVTPVPAVAWPFTGAPHAAHEPLHFEVVGVSGTNQYRVKPLALVSTVAPPIVAVFSALPDAVAAAEACGAAGGGAGGGAAAAAAPAGAELPELPQAAITSATAPTPAGASHLIFITCP